jgi:hypothetical protein
MIVGAIQYDAHEKMLIQCETFLKVINFQVQFKNSSYNKDDFAKILLRKASTL